MIVWHAMARWGSRYQTLQLQLAVATIEASTGVATNALIDYSTELALA